jgi:hypothetical protein
MLVDDETTHFVFFSFFSVLGLGLGCGVVGRAAGLLPS